MASPPPKRVLLLTNSEHGQANVFLATAHAFLTLPDQHVEVHFASFSPIAKQVESTSAYALSHAPSPSHQIQPIIFHPLPGLPMNKAWSRPEFEAENDGSRHRQGILQAWRRMLILLKCTLPWTGPEFMEIFDGVVDVVNRVNPHITAVDPAFSPGLTAVRHLGVKYVILSPNTIKDFAMPFQPMGEALWKYPCVGAPFQYPIPWKQIPLNILLIFFALVVSTLDPHRSKIQRYVGEHTAPPARLTTLSDLSLGPPSEGVKILVANRLALEFPLKVLPPHVIPVGPIIRPVPALKEVDPEMCSWLRRGPTVYVNLGTHVAMSEASAGEMAWALRSVIDAWRGKGTMEKGLGTLQVLWKLGLERGPGSYVSEGKHVQHSIRSVLGQEIEDGHVRIVEWIEAEPIAVLAEETIVCAVHHGGANSFLETVSTGIPQVVLPVWMDTFDFARRVELLGIGRWGNKVSSHRGAWGSELARALIEVLLGVEAERMRKRARQLAALCDKKNGRDIAARIILKEIGDEVAEGVGVASDAKLKEQLLSSKASFPTLN